MTRLLAGAALASVVTFAGPAFAITDPIKIESGQVSGGAGTNAPAVRSYKGIPFAAPPTGDNRWRAPQPVAKWDGIRKAETFGAPCTAGPAPAGRGGPGRGGAGRGGAGRGAAAPGAAATPAPQPPPREPA